MNDILNATGILEKQLQKSLTGIQGLDEITNGGLPRGRTSLVCGSAGCGKTLFAMEFICRGALEFNEPGVYMTFEETCEDLIQNFQSLGFDLEDLMDSKKILIDYVFIERSEIEETGEYDLDGLFLRLENAINTIGAKRVVLYTLEALFSGFSNESILRAELRRLFRWLKDKKMTAIITGERGEKSVTKYGLEEYVADCVILLDHKTVDQIANRSIKILKYRGSKHGSNEYPFIIGDNGISILPLTSTNLEYNVTNERISSGIPGLDRMLGDKGFYLISSILVSGTAGSGKTNFAAKFVDSSCRSGKKCLFFAFEESPAQIIRNVKNIGIDLSGWIDTGMLSFIANRPSHSVVEMHLVIMNEYIMKMKPDIVIIDSVTNLLGSGELKDVKSMLIRLLDNLKSNGITTLMTDLISDNSAFHSEVGISSLIDTWLRLVNSERNNELIRTANVIKSRGMRHSNSITEFLINSEGIQFLKDNSSK